MGSLRVATALGPLLRSRPTCRNAGRVRPWGKSLCCSSPTTSNKRVISPNMPGSVCRRECVSKTNLSQASERMTVEGELQERCLQGLTPVLRTTIHAVLSILISADVVTSASASEAFTSASLPQQMPADVAVSDVALSQEAGVSGAQNTPYFREKEWQQLGLLEGRIRPCPTALNPNCVSTSSLNRSYGEPWVIPPKSRASAAAKIQSALELSQQGAKILRVEDTPTGCYILAEVNGPFGKDSLEFLVKGEDELVLYRAMAGKVMYIYPFTTPITDFDAQRKHMAAVRDELGWDQIAGACDYGVCSVYEDAEDENVVKFEPRILPF